MPGKKRSKELTKERLVNAAAELLKERESGELITVKDIAERAETSVGLVNYHFSSRDALLALAAERVWEPFGSAWDALRQAKGPGEFKRKLTEVLIAVSDAVDSQKSAARVTIGQELVRGRFETTRFLARLIMDAVPEYGEKNARLAAWLLVPSLQLAILFQEEFEEYYGARLEDKTARNRLIEDSVERVLGDMEADNSRLDS